MKKMMMKNLKVQTFSRPMYLLLHRTSPHFTADRTAAGYGHGCSGSQPAHADSAGDGGPGEEGEEAEAYPGRRRGVWGQVTTPWMVGDWAVCLDPAAVDSSIDGWMTLSQSQHSSAIAFDAYKLSQ